VQDQSSAAAMGLLKTEFGSDGLYVGYDKRRRNCEKKTAMTAHKLEVCNRCIPTYSIANNVISIGVLRIEPHSGRFATRERSR
jgi:hypothetical protein